MPRSCGATGGDCLLHRADSLAYTAAARLAPCWAAMAPRIFAVLVIALLALAGTWALRAGWLAIPDRYNPWAELAPLETSNLLTPMKLRRAQQSPARCLALLHESGAQFEPVPDRVTGEGCALANAVRLRGAAQAPLRTPVLASCRVALSFAMWERHVLQPAAEASLGTRIARIDHLGGYACRDVVNGRRPPEGGAGRRSRHALADALDIAAFTRADGGAPVVVRGDWTPDGDAGAAAEQQAAFLRAAHQGACSFFDGVLGPDYNAVHADHFHFEVGGWRSCR